MTRAKFGGVLAALIAIVILTMAFNVGTAAGAPTTITAYKSTIAVNVKSPYQASQWTDTQTFDEPNSGMTFAVKYNSTGWLFLMQWKQSANVCTDQYCFGGIELGNLTNTQPMGSLTTPTIMILASTSFTGGIDEFVSTGEMTPTSVQSSGYSVQTTCGTASSGTQYTAVCYRPFKLTNASPHDFPTLGVGSTIEIGFALGEFSNPGDHYASDMSTYVLTFSASTYTSTTSTTSTASSTSSTSLSTQSTTSSTSKTSSSSTGSTTSSTQSSTSSKSTSSTSAEPFTVTTNSNKYSDSQTGTISGTETEASSAIGTVDIMVTNPAGNDVFSNAVAIQPNGSFNDTFYTGASNLWTTGTYTITAYWSIYTASSTFAYTGSTSSSTTSSGSTSVATTPTQTTTSTTTQTTTSTTTQTTTSTTTQTSTSTSTSNSTVIPSWVYAVIIILLLVGIGVGFAFRNLMDANRNRPATRLST